MGCCCCGVRTSAVLICILYLLLHGGFLALTILFMTNPDENLKQMISILDTEDGRLKSSSFYASLEPYLLQNSGEYFALPVTVITILMVSNILASWGALSSYRLLLLPWLFLYFILILFVSSLLIYIMVILHDVWFQVILFLITSPVIVVGTAFWIVMLRLYRAMRISSSKGTSPLTRPLPPTVYTPEPHSWDQPLPIWAVGPPESAWDPSYLQQIDPRFEETPEPSTRISRSSRTRSFRSQSQTDGSFRESDLTHSSIHEAAFHQIDSMSLSDKYGHDRHRYGESSDDGYEYHEGHPSHNQFSNEEHPYHSSVTDQSTESDLEYADQFQHKVEVCLEVLDPDFYATSFSLLQGKMKAMKLSQYQDQNLDL